MLKERYIQRYLSDKCVDIIDIGLYRDNLYTKYGTLY